MASVAVNEKNLQEIPESEAKPHKKSKKPKESKSSDISDGKTADLVQLEEAVPQSDSPLETSPVDETGAQNEPTKKSRSSPEIDPRIVALERQILDSKSSLQKLEEKAAKAQEAYEREAKAKKELETLYAKLLSEKTELLNSLEGEKGSLSETQERANKLQAQKSDLESQLQVSTLLLIN